jgi:hypothetical protein
MPFFLLRLPLCGVDLTVEGDERANMKRIEEATKKALTFDP